MPPGQPRADPDQPGVEPAQPARDQREHARGPPCPGRRPARFARAADPESTSSRSRPRISSPSADRRRRDQGRRPARSAAAAAGSRRGSARRGLAQERLAERDARARPREASRAGATPGAGGARFLAVGQRDDQEPAEPGQLERPPGPAGEHRASVDASVERSPAAGIRGSARSARARTPPRRPPAARSWSGVPLATSRIRSKRRRPTLSTGSPSRIGPASRSMSSIIRSYIGVLVATLMHGRRLEAQHAAAARGEDQHVGAAGDQAGGAGGVVARRVHEDQAGRVDPLGVRRRRRPGRSSRPWPARPATSRRSSSGRRPCCPARGCCRSRRRRRRCTTPTT